MKYSIFFLLILIFSCTPEKETFVKSNKFNLDSLKSIQKEEINQLERQFWAKLDTLNKRLAEEKLRTAAKFNYLDFENFIKVHNEIPNDSIRLIGAERYGGHPDDHVITFIDYNKNSKYHNQLLSQYRYDYNKSNLMSNKNNSLKNGHWLKIKKHYNEGYAFYYGKGEFMTKGFTISDSILISYDNMEESDGTIKNIDNVKSFDNMININEGQYIIYPSEDNPDVFICREGRSLSFIIHETHLNKYPIIVKDSHEMGSSAQIKFINPE